MLQHTFGRGVALALVATTAIVSTSPAYGQVTSGMLVQPPAAAAPAATAAPGTCVMQPTGDGRFVLQPGCFAAVPAATQQVSIDTTGAPSQVMMDFNERTGAQIMNFTDAVRSKMNQGMPYPEARQYVMNVAQGNFYACTQLYQDEKKDENAKPLRYFLYGLGLVGSVVATKGMSKAARLGYVGMEATSLALNEVTINRWDFKNSIWRGGFEDWCKSEGMWHGRMDEDRRSRTAWRNATGF